LVHEQYNNITNAPLFSDRAGGNYRLSSSSPCIDGGVNGYARSSSDFDGNPRLVNDVDIGAFEYQSEIADDDLDGLSNAAELGYNTNPFNPDSDDDGFTDGWEVVQGWNPVHSDLDVSAYISSNTSVFGYYTEDSVGDLSMGTMMVGVSNTVVNLSFDVLQSGDLIHWTNIGQSVQWTIPATNREYFRIHAEP